MGSYANNWHSSCCIENGMKLLLVYIIPFFLLSQENADTIPSPWEKTVLEKCNTAKDIGYLSKAEKEVIFYLNLVRTNPSLFADTYLKQYVDTAQISKNNYLKSLYSDLYAMPSVCVLIPKFDLFELAKRHAIDMGTHGKVGHVSSNNSSLIQRAKSVTHPYSLVQENCQYGLNNPLAIVIDLLIDQDIVDVGHRKSLLDKNARYIGTAIRRHKVYEYNCVIELGGELKKK